MFWRCCVPGRIAPSTRSLHRFHRQERDAPLGVRVAADRDGLTHLADHLIRQRGLVLRGEQDVDLLRPLLEQPHGNTLLGAVDATLLVARALGTHGAVTERVDHLAGYAHGLSPGLDPGGAAPRRTDRPPHAPPHG